MEDADGDGAERFEQHARPEGEPGAEPEAHDLPGIFPGQPSRQPAEDPSRGHARDARKKCHRAAEQTRQDTPGGHKQSRSPGRPGEGVISPAS